MRGWQYYAPVCVAGGPHMAIGGWMEGPCFTVCRLATAQQAPRLVVVVVVVVRLAGRVEKRQ
jgi:hypothetical protein